MRFYLFWSRGWRQRKSMAMLRPGQVCQELANLLPTRKGGKEFVEFALDDAAITSVVLLLCGRVRTSRL
jgi:hypothetical protein